MKSLPPAVLAMIEDLLKNPVLAKAGLELLRTAANAAIDDLEAHPDKIPALLDWLQSFHA